MRGHLDRSAVLAVSGAALLSMALGSVHAFSVFLIPMEEVFGASRSAISLTYSLALASLTAVVLLGPRIFGRIAPSFLILASGLVAAGGLLLAAAAPSLPLVWLGYGVIFGAANGLGYGFGLQFAAQSAPGREGLAMGVVTAAYALGAAGAPPLLQAQIEGGGVGTALQGLAAIIGVTGLIATLFTGASKSRFQAETRGKTNDEAPVLYFWISYGAGAAAGLMAIGHAVALAETAGTPPWVAPAVVAVFNLTGSLGAGVLADRASMRILMTLTPLISAASLIALAVGVWPIAPLALIGLSYGAIITLHPAAIARAVGPARSASVYGRVFTAWGFAGLTAPVAAGALYDATGGYGLALAVAASLALIAALVGFDKIGN
ncbi:MAG: MFS transporter [Pseudomonadota bacterium]